MTAAKTHPPRTVILYPGPDFIPDGVTPACREPGVDPEWFFPIGDRYSDKGRKVCRGCSLQVECADWAIAVGERYGIYGGLDPKEREEIVPDQTDYADIWSSRSFSVESSVNTGGGE